MGVRVERVTPMHRKKEKIATPLEISRGLLGLTGRDGDVCLRDPTPHAPIDRVAEGEGGHDMRPPRGGNEANLGRGADDTAEKKGSGVLIEGEV